jgi:hypothetical protein
MINDFQQLRDKIAIMPLFLKADQIELNLDEEKYLDIFRNSWNDLEKDSYITNSPHPRLRRHCRFKYCRVSADLTLEPHGPYYQSSQDNPLYGGIVRTFAPVRSEITENPLFISLLKFNANILPVQYDTILINCHFVRITSVVGCPGEPSPEGPHRDGFDYVSIHMINVENCTGGETSISNFTGKTIFKNVLSSFLDSLYINDRLFAHYTTPIFTTKEVGFRDVLLCSYEDYSQLSDKISNK